MKRYLFWLASFWLASFWLASFGMIAVWAAGVAPIAPADPGPIVTPTRVLISPTLTPTTEPTSPPVVVEDPVQTAVEVLSVEPTSLIDVSGGMVSVYGTGFTETSVVRLIGHGLLETTYINATALKAQVPTGLKAGTYDLQISDGTATATLPRALSILAATPTPKPKSPPSAPPPPAPGRPILTIRSYTVEPAQVRAGQEFVVTLEFYNNGSRAGENTMVVFPGDTFLPVGENGHMIWQLHINHTAVVSQRMRAPASLTTGVYQVQVNASANDFSGEHYDYPQTVAVEVIGGSTGTAPVGQPKVVVEAAETDPQVLVPGEPFSLTLRLANRGRRTALNVLATCASEKMAVPTTGSDTVSTPKIDIDATVTVTLALMLADVDQGGRQTMAIALEYADYSGGAYTAQQNIGVDINTSLTKKPQLIIRQYATEPDTLSPGDTFSLSLALANVGGGDAHRITLALGGEKGESLEPFIPLASGNVLFIETLGRGEQLEVAQPFIIDGGADPKAYNLPIALAYDDPRSIRQSDIQRLSLVVRHRPELQVTFYQQPEPLSLGNPMPLSLEIINIGRGAVNVANMDAIVPQGDVQRQGSPFVGPLDAGGSAPLDIIVTIREPGDTELTIEIRHRDAFNQTQVLTQTLPLTVSDAPAPPDPGQSNAPVEIEETVGQKMMRALKGLLGLGS